MKSSPPAISLGVSATWRLPERLFELFRPSPGTRICIISPHLDDAVLSLGAFIARATNRGAQVTVLTVFANNPLGLTAANAWDRLCGFSTSGEAARARRQEDRRACEILGASPVWLPFADEEYAAPRSTESIWRALLPHMRAADIVALPGYPLVNRDHLWLTEMVLTRCRDVTLYTEAPYATNEVLIPPPTLKLVTSAVPSLFGRNVARELPNVGHATRETVEWRRIPSTRSDRVRKWAAVRAYVSQLDALDGHLIKRARLYQALIGEQFGFFQDSLAARGA